MGVGVGLGVCVGVGSASGSDANRRGRSGTRARGGSSGVGVRRRALGVGVGVGVGVGLGRTFFLSTPTLTSRSDTYLSIFSSRLSVGASGRHRPLSPVTRCSGHVQQARSQMSGPRGCRPAPRAGGSLLELDDPALPREATSSSGSSSPLWPSSTRSEWFLQPEPSRAPRRRLSERRSALRGEPVSSRPVPREPEGRAPAGRAGRARKGSATCRLDAHPCRILPLTVSTSADRH